MDTGVEWEAMEESGVTPSLERCDTGDGRVGQPVQRERLVNDSCGCGVGTGVAMTDNDGAGKF